MTQPVQPDVQNPPKVAEGTRMPAQVVTLILDPREEPVYTLNQETDAHTALTRGLVQYLAAQGPWTDVGGRVIEIKKTADTWAEPESFVDYPAIVAYGPEEGVYDASKMSPVVDLSDAVPGVQDTYLVSAAEFTQELYLEAWCTDDQERKALVAMIESAMNAVNWMYGFKLALPHYFGAVGVYHPKSMGYIDSAEAAMQRYRVARFRVDAQINVLRPFKLPPTQARTTTSLVAAAGSLGPGYIRP